MGFTATSVFSFLDALEKTADFSHEIPLLVAKAKLRKTGGLTKKSSRRLEKLNSATKLYLAKLASADVEGFDPETLADLGDDPIGDALRRMEISMSEELASMLESSAPPEIIHKSASGRLKVVLNKYASLAKARVGHDWLVATGINPKPSIEDSTLAYKHASASGLLYALPELLNDEIENRKEPVVLPVEAGRFIVNQVLKSSK